MPRLCFLQHLSFFLNAVSKGNKAHPVLQVNLFSTIRNSERNRGCPIPKNRYFCCPQLTAAQTISPISNWSPSGTHPLIISGPCGAETREQVIATAEGLAAIPQIKVFRAGIWKPRTLPGSFEGVGRIGLEWLKEVKEKFGLLTTVEVANAEHVKEALAAGVDILWIGARTTVNPFSVQEIADAVKGKDIPVMVKNPIHADIKLWIGAIERMARAGITKLIAVHRGFHTHDVSKFRNVPHWEIPIELKVTIPNIPVICDPSHISGKREYLLELSQKALDLGMDGLMIESHCNPAMALSDKEQQLVPPELKELLNKLCFRAQGFTDQKYTNELARLRDIIDEIDMELISGLLKRHEIIEKIGGYKKENNVAVFQLERWKEILQTRTAWASEKGLSISFIEKICQLLHEESIRIQTELLNKK